MATPVQSGTGRCGETFQTIGVGLIQFMRMDGQYERRLLFANIKDVAPAHEIERYEAFARPNQAHSQRV